MNQNLLLINVWETEDSALNNINSTATSLFKGLQILLLALHKANLFSQHFLGKSNLD